MNFEEVTGIGGSGRMEIGAWNEFSRIELEARTGCNTQPKSRHDFRQCTFVLAVTKSNLDEIS